jgi:hypothetical protein
MGDEESPGHDEPDLYDYAYSNLLDDVNILQPVADCEKCGAKRFQYETKGFCCRDGQVKLPEQETPPDMMRLWTSSDDNARHFRDHIRWFNSHFSFTSLYCSLDQDTTDLRKHPIYTFWAHGQMYHNIHGFGKQDGIDSSHLELYFYDDDLALEHHFRKCRMDQQQKDREVITMLVNILQGNPYSETLRTMGQLEDTNDYCISLNLDPQKDHRTYNLPVSSKVVAVWVESQDRLRQFNRGVCLHGKDRQITRIQSYDASYDHLSYPLFFPRGEPGWHANIPKTKFNYEDVFAESARKRIRGAHDVGRGYC